jgi:hypothetical protein
MARSIGGKGNGRFSDAPDTGLGGSLPPIVPPNDRVTTVVGGAPRGPCESTRVRADSAAAAGHAGADAEAHAGWGAARTATVVIRGRQGGGGGEARPRHRSRARLHGHFHRRTNVNWPASTGQPPGSQTLEPLGEPLNTEWRACPYTLHAHTHTCTHNLSLHSCRGRHRDTARRRQRAHTCGRSRTRAGGGPAAGGVLGAGKVGLWHDDSGTMKFVPGLRAESGSRQGSCGRGRSGRRGAAGGGVAAQPCTA